MNDCQFVQLLFVKRDSHLSGVIQINRHSNERRLPNFTKIYFMCAVNQLNLLQSMTRSIQKLAKKYGAQNDCILHSRL